MLLGHTVKEPAGNAVDLFGRSTEASRVSGQPWRLSPSPPSL